VHNGYKEKNGRRGEKEIEERCDEPTEGNSPKANSAMQNWEN
jgi:hypothetical protein